MSDASDIKPLFYVAGGLGLAALLSAILSNSGPAAKFSISQLVDPEAVKPIFNDIEALGGDEVLNAWQYAGGTIKYDYFASMLHFYDSTVNCQKCVLPMQVASKGSSNCVGKSVLLASLLRNIYGPQDVYVAIGQYVRQDVEGHAWVMLRKNGSWQLIEATQPPSKNNAWISANTLSDVYVPLVLFNDQGMICYNEHLCTVDVSIGGGPCCHCACECEK